MIETLGPSLIALRYSNGAEGCVQCNVTRARERDQRRRDVRVADGTMAELLALSLKEQRVEE